VIGEALRNLRVTTVTIDGEVPRDNQDGTVASIRMGLCRGWPDGARA
jgi:hypothetical protein